MQLIQLQYFCTIARLGNMRRAAEELWISQPGLSKAISSLEDEIGVKLFDRSTGRNIELNDAGQLFYDQIVHSLYQINNAVRQVQELGRSNVRGLKVLFSAGNFISAWLRQRFHSMYPELTLNFKSCHSVSALDAIGFDFHIFATPTHYDDIEYVDLLEEDLLLAMAHDHPLASRDEITLLDTRQYPYQCLPENENLHLNLINFCAQAGFTPKIALCTEDSFSYFYDLANNGLIAMLPSRTAFTTITDGIAVKPIAGSPECRRTIRLGWNKNCKLNEDMKRFIDFCIETFAQDDMSNAAERKR